MATVVSATCFATPAAANPLVDAWNGIVSFFAGDARAAGEEIQSITDGSTLNGWSNHLTPGAASTENIGRIWTDKTVADEDVQLSGGADMTVQKGTSDFLVGLSALGSMSSVTTASTTPLDIVLVLDTSGSMQDVFGGEAQYEPVYSNADDFDATLGHYYVLDDGEYTRLSYPRGNDSRYIWYKKNGDAQYVTPKTNANDRQNTQFYRVKNSRLAALKQAVNNFISTTTAANSEITDTDMQHRIALVNFGSSKESKIIDGLTSNVDQLKTDVNALMARNGTRTDTGMALGQEALKSARQGSRKWLFSLRTVSPLRLILVRNGVM